MLLPEAISQLSQLQTLDGNQLSTLPEAIGQLAELEELRLSGNDLGIAMNYARDERLRDTIVLRPDWLANGIYAVLRATLFAATQAAAGDGRTAGR